MATLRRFDSSSPASSTSTTSPTPKPVPADPAPASAPRVDRVGAGKVAPERLDRYQDMTDRIVRALESGIIPWRREWDSVTTWPCNGISDRPHHGVNVPMLMSMGYQDGRWATFEQAKKAGWRVRRGEKGTPIYFFKPFERQVGEDPETGDPVLKKIPILVRFTVFNFSQIDGTPEKAYPPASPNVDPGTVEQIEDIIAAMGVEVAHGFRTPCFQMGSDGTDRICMPDRASFESDAAYYATKLHELVHWTGHPERMNRVFARDRQSPDYAREELRAEIGSAMLCAKLGIPYAVDGHAGYIDGYLSLLKSDKREIYRASRDAERIATHILAHHPDFRDDIRIEAAALAGDARVAGMEEHFDASAFDYDDDAVLDMEAVVGDYSL